MPRETDGSYLSRENNNVVVVHARSKLAIVIQQQNIYSVYIAI